MTVSELSYLTKGEATRLTIIDASVELFLENGYHATSMRRIAERSGLALGGIYNHFASKEAIFEAVVVEKHPFNRVLPLIAGIEEETTPISLRNAALIAISEFQKEPDYLKLMFIELVEFHGRHSETLILEFMPRLVEVIDRLGTRGDEVRLVDSRLLARSFLGMIISYVITDFVIGGSRLVERPPDAVEAYVDLFLHGAMGNRCC